MVFETPAINEAIRQGDIITDCPIVYWKSDSIETQLAPQQSLAQVIVLTQSCDLAQTKTERVLVGIVHRIQYLVDSKTLKVALIRDQIRMHRVYG